MDDALWNAAGLQRLIEALAELEVSDGGWDGAGLQRMIV